MSKKIPIGGFKWVNPKKHTEERIKNCDEDSKMVWYLK